MTCPGAKLISGRILVIEKKQERTTGKAADAAAG
jgi:hypothetical protein